MREKRNLYGFLLIPAIAWLVLFMLLPLLLMAYFSFGTMDGASMTLGTKLTTANYVRLTQSPLYLKVLLNSFRLALVVVAICLVIGYPTAYWLARRSHLTKFVFLCLILVPFWTSVLLRTYSWILLLQSNGIVNGLIMALRLSGSPLRMLWTEGGVSIACAQIYLPFMIMPLFAVLEMHDWRLVEAAKNLGANKLRAFLKVTLPLSVPGLVVGVLFVFVPVVGEYLVPSMIGGPNYEVVTSVIESNFGWTLNWPLGCALAIILALLICAVIVLLLRIAPPWRLLEKRS